MQGRFYDLLPQLVINTGVKVEGREDESDGPKMRFQLAGQVDGISHPASGDGDGGGNTRHFKSPDRMSECTYLRYDLEG